MSSGHEKSPGPGGATVMLPLAARFRIAKVPLLETGLVTVSLFAAEGCFPPPLMHPYVALASADAVMSASLAVFPSPTSRKLTTRLLPERLAVAFWKWGL